MKDTLVDVTLPGDKYSNPTKDTLKSYKKALGVGLQRYKLEPGKIQPNKQLVSKGLNDKVYASYPDPKNG